MKGTHGALKILTRVQFFNSRLKGFARQFTGRFSRLEKIVIVFLLLIIVVALSWRLISSEDKTVFQPIQGGSVIEGVVGYPQIINPLYSQASSIDQDIVKLVFSGLVKMGRGREFVPDLAVSWSVLNQGKTYIFNLRDDVVWHDGQSFNADDVVFTIRVIQSDSYQGVLKENWSNIEATALNSNTVQFTLPNPSTFFLSQATIGLLPAHLFAHLPVVNIGDPSHNYKPIGTGPYKIVSTANLRDSVTLTMNNDYYDQIPFVEKIVFYFYDNEKSLLNALRNGTVTSGGFTFLNESLEADLTNINTYIYQLPQYKAVFINQLGGNQALADKSVRQALALATNKSRIIRDVADGNASLVDSPILPGFWGHLPDIQVYPFDFIAARDALHRGGWKDADGDGFLEKGDIKLSFTLSFKEDLTNNAIAGILASDWEAIGIQVLLNPVPPIDLFDLIIRPRNYDMLIFGQNLGSDSDPYVYWHSSQTNDPGLALSIMYDKDIDNNLELARLSSNLNRAIDYYHRFQRAFAQELPAILLYQPNFVYLVDSKVKGVTDEINFGSISDRFINIGEWYIKYQRTSQQAEEGDGEEAIADEAEKEMDKSE